MKISHDEPILKFLFKTDFIHYNAIFFVSFIMVMSPTIHFSALEKDPHAII